MNASKDAKIIPKIAPPPKLPLLFVGIGIPDGPIPTHDKNS